MVLAVFYIGGNWTACSSGWKKCRIPIPTRAKDRRPNHRNRAPRAQAALEPQRIHNEIIVDAYGPEEQALGWYYYLENKVQFPFTARCIVSKVVSPLRKGETVEVPGLAPEDSCAHDMLVSIRWHGRHVAAPLSQLTAIDADESTVEAIGDWHYWLAQGYCF